MKATVAVLLCVFLAACATRDAGVKWEADPHAALGKLKTYAWAPGPPPAANDPHLDDNADRQIRAAVDRALTERGYLKADTDHAEFWVGYYARPLSDDEMSAVYSYSGPGVGRSGRPFNRRPDSLPNSHKENLRLLNLFVVDPHTRESLWHGVGQTEIGPKDAIEQRDQRLLEAARAILAQFPPEKPQSE